MASRKDTILKAAQRTAKQAHSAATQRRKRPSSRVNVDPHRHCSVCWKPVSLESDPPICGDGDCLRMYERREKSRKRFSFIMYLGIAVFVGMLVVQIYMGASG